MLRAILKPLRSLLLLFVDANSPAQVACGFAVGMLIGLVPKDNLVAVLLSTVLVATKVNLGAAAAGALVFSWLGMWLDPVSHQIGLSLLTAPALEPMWTRLNGLPVVPWTHFNNTVVLGSVLVGASLFIPVYFCARLLIHHHRPRVQRAVERFGILQWLERTDKATKWSIS